MCDDNWLDVQAGLKWLVRLSSNLLLLRVQPVWEELPFLPFPPSAIYRWSRHASSSGPSTSAPTMTADQNCTSPLEAKWSKGWGNVAGSSLSRWHFLQVSWAPRRTSTLIGRLSNEDRPQLSGKDEGRCKLIIAPSKPILCSPSTYRTMAWGSFKGSHQVYPL